MLISKKLICIVATLAALAFFLAVLPSGTKATGDDDKDKKKIRISLKTTVERGMAPLPVHFVAQITAPSELDETVYKSDREWVIMGSFLLTDELTGGDTTPPEMRGEPMSGDENFLRSQKHLVAKNRIRASRKPFKAGAEVKKEYEYDYTFEKAGTYYMQFRLARGKWSSNEVRILVKGDTAFNPYKPY